MAFRAFIYISVISACGGKEVTTEHTYFLAQALPPLNRFTMGPFYSGVLMVYILYIHAQPLPEDCSSPNRKTLNGSQWGELFLILCVNLSFSHVFFFVFFLGLNLMAK